MMLWNARTEWSHATLQDLQWSSIDLNSMALLQSNARSRLRPERNKISFQNDAIFKSTNLKDMFKNDSYKSKIVVDKASKCMHSRWKGLRHVRYRHSDLVFDMTWLMMPNHAKLHFMITLQATKVNNWPSLGRFKCNLRCTSEFVFWAVKMQ